jgi:hypothetical protein
MNALSIEGGGEMIKEAQEMSPASRSLVSVAKMMRRSVTPLAYLSAQGEWRWWLEEWNRKHKNFKEM